MIYLSGGAGGCIRGLYTHFKKGFIFLLLLLLSLFLFLFLFLCLFLFLFLFLFLLLAGTTTGWWKCSGKRLRAGAQI